MKSLAIHVTRNSPGKWDSSGAFKPEAVAFEKLHGCQREGLDNSLPLPKRRDAVEVILSRYHDLECVAFFCHGLRRSLQTGHDLSTVGALADAIAAASGPHVVVPLYACSTAAADNGFAATLARELHARGKTGWVDGHTNAGHTTKNPNVRRFTLGAKGGEWIVEPGSSLSRNWRAALSKELRFRFPLLTLAQIRAELAPAIAYTANVR